MLFFAEFVLVRCCGENLYQAWRLYPVITWLQVSSSSQKKFTLHGYSKLDGLIFCAHKGKHLFLDETNLSQFSPLCSVTRMRDGWLFLAYTFSWFRSFSRLLVSRWREVCNFWGICGPKFFRRLGPKLNFSWLCPAGCLSLAETANRADSGQLQFWSEPSEILNVRSSSTPETVAFTIPWYQTWWNP